MPSPLAMPADGAGAGVDRVLLDDWHPVAAADAIVPGTSLPVMLLGKELVVWRTGDGTLHVAEDRCPHRGTRLSMGRVDGESLVCAYHGWRFASSGKCVRIPAHPELVPPGAARLAMHHARERYGLVWACAGEPRGDVPAFPEAADPRLRKVVCGPYRVETSGPRIVENFLDMAHFPFVHAGILGEEPKNEVRDYEAGPFDDGNGDTGIQASGCFFWQPRTNSLAHGGCEVEYTYRVVRPLTAILTKVPDTDDGFHEAISLHVQPVHEESSIAWMVLAMTNAQQDDQTLRAFQDRIFLQDLPILENQVPKRLPLERRVEIPVRADRLSLAYRDYLRQAGLRHGVIAARIS
jgi:phenylpropionate dioxygenase-like ring-hydroxylating dioxygenase large terminal subunit